MLLQLTRTTGDPIIINIHQVLSIYPLGNGQTYIVFPTERFNLTVEESFEDIRQAIQEEVSTPAAGLRPVKK